MTRPKEVPMNKIFLCILFICQLGLAKDVELGAYTAIDVETSTVVSTILLRADKTVNYTVSTPDFAMPEPGCEGTYTVIENKLTAELACPLSFLPNVRVEIDITEVNPESVRSESGVVVPVIIDAFGTEPTPFILKKK